MWLEGHTAATEQLGESLRSVTHALHDARRDALERKWDRSDLMQTTTHVWAFLLGAITAATAMLLLQVAMRGFG